MQEYKKIFITKDEVVPTAKRMKEAGVHLAMIHAFINKEGKGNVSYEYEVGTGIESYTVDGENSLPSIESIYDLGAQWAEREISEEDRAAITAKYEKVAAMREELDRELSEKATDWKLNRIGRVELTILRLALYEMRYDDDIPEKVAIDEAVELAKKFGQADAPKFVNGVLAKFATSER